MAGIAALVLVALAIVWGLGRFSTDPAAVQGRVRIESSPAGAQVLEAGRHLGYTPVSLTLAPGKHAVVLQQDGASRNLVIDVAAGSEVVHHVELVQAPSTGTLHVATDPPGAEVVLDGTPRGVSPVDISGIAPGEHRVTLRRQGGTWAHRVTTVAGGNASLVVPLTQTDAPAAGWLGVSSPIELQLYEGGVLVGNSRMDRVMLRSGEHRLRLLNLDLGFETTSTVQIQTGSLSRLSVDVPTGLLSVNAVPWAEVYLDGERIGETPIANFAARLGQHDLLLRNPNFGEQRRTVTVSLKAPVRVGVDLRQ